MGVIGYKTFNKGLINNYGKKFEVGKIYISPGIIKFGLHGNGFHICKNFEDTFRYYNAWEDEIDLCLVEGSGNFDKYNDEYYGYYDMYCFGKIEIIKQLSHLEIIEKGLKLNEIRAERFVSLFPLTQEEIILFKEQFKKHINVLDAIAYYQENDKEIYFKKLELSKFK